MESQCVCVCVCVGGGGIDKENVVLSVLLLQ